MFSGERGTGKTSAAKILARAVNCLHPENGEPCNKCEICKAALEGSLTDIVEMDAASNNGVEDIRAIRDEINFLPTLAKYRIYIIDEVHMLSTGAFNALLKTLEEPPAHVKFILATTEPQKLPATIISRCQRFDFKRISEENLVKRLDFICKENKIEISEDGKKTIAVLAEGAARDALSILERCAQEGGTITAETVKDIVGIPKTTEINQMMNSIITNNTEQALQTLHKTILDGKDLNNFLWEMIKYTKDLLVYKASGKLQLYTEEELNKIKELSEKATKERLISIIFELSELEKELKWSTQKTIVFEVELIKLCNNIQNKNNTNNENNNEDIEVLKRKVSELENKMSLNSNKQQVINTSIRNVENKDQKQKNTENNSLKSTSIPIMKMDSINCGDEIKNWQEIIAKMKQDGKIMLYTNLMNSKAIKTNDMMVELNFPKGLTPFGKAILEKSENISAIEKEISISCGKPMRIKIKEDNDKKVVQDSNSGIDDLEKLDIPINIIDD